MTKTKAKYPPFLANKHMEVCVRVIALACIQHHLIYDLTSPQDTNHKFDGLTLRVIFF